MKRTAGLCLVMLGLVGCGSIHDSPDFYRHSLSQMSEPSEGGDYVWFDVKFSPENPNDNENAEAMRMQWLEAWLDVRKICGDGYVILERREFDFLEHNPGRYDMRYKVQCDVKAPSA
jgi:hypothetical protein